MDDHSNTDWEILISGLKSCILQTPSDGYVDMEEDEEEDDDDDEEEEEEEEDEEGYDDGDFSHDIGKSDLACPFCSEDFDVLGLCCHIDSDHRVESKAGICPLCSIKVGTNMATHVIAQHEKVLKALSKRKLQNGRSLSALSLLRKELLSAYLQKKSSHLNSTSNFAPDPLLLSFVSNQQSADRRHTTDSYIPTETSLSRKCLDDNDIESSQASPNKDQEEKIQRSEFVKGLVFSTIFEEDDL